MAATAKTVLPEESELTVQELDVSWPVLQTASVYIGKACEWYNNVSYFLRLVGFEKNIGSDMTFTCCVC